MTLFFERLHARRALRDFAPLDAGAREGDRVQVTGTIRALGPLLVAPISAIPCVGYVARVRGHTSTSGKLAATDWLETLQLSPFALDDAIVVDGSHALFAVTRQATARRDPARETSFLAKHAIHLGGARFFEILVEPGRRVSVGGTLSLVPRAAPPTGERGFRDEVPPEPQLSGNREMPLVIVTR